MSQTLTSKLIVTLPSDLEIKMTRAFDAPRELVFEAHSKQEHVRQWWGCHKSTLTACEMDFRVGGAWRFVMREKESGREHPFKGEYREISRPERLAYTFIYDVEPYSAEVAVETIEFVEEHGRTHLVSTTRYSCKEARDGVLASGMEQGAGESMDRLEELLATMGAR